MSLPPNIAPFTFLWLFYFILSHPIRAVKWLVEVLRPTRHKTGDFGDVLPNRSPGLVLNYDAQLKLEPFHAVAVEVTSSLSVPYDTQFVALRDLTVLAIFIISPEISSLFFNGIRRQQPAIHSATNQTWRWTSSSSSSSSSSPQCIREDQGSNLTAGSCVYHDSHCDIQPWARLHTLTAVLGRLSLPSSVGR